MKKQTINVQRLLKRGFEMLNGERLLLCPKKTTTGREVRISSGGTLYVEGVSIANLTTLVELDMMLVLLCGETK